MVLSPPAFEEASNCSVCGCSFGTFKRRHHCRSCGKSLCNEHSSNQMALPRFGLHAPVRVCNNCFTTTTTSSVSPEPGVTVPSLSNDAEKTVSWEETTLKFSSSAETRPEEPEEVLSTVLGFECTCGMPLCICSAPEPPKIDPPAPSAAGSSSRNRRVTPAPKQTASKTSISGSFFPNGQITSQCEEQRSTRSYDATGEGMREAIKNQDIDAVKDLLLKGVDPNFTDKQGMTLLHLAAVFNLTQICFTLLDAGASIHAKNSQGETPLDCAPATLQYKLRERLPELGPQ